MDDALILPVSSCSLVFGLDWLPLLSGRAARMAYRTARQRRATHLVIAGEAAGAIGFASVRGRQFGRHTALHSAAQNLARLYGSGTVALLMELADGHHWLVAVHEGAVVARTDKVFRCPGQAGQGLGELKQAFPQLTVLGEGQSPAAPSLAALAAASDRHSRLLRVARSYSRLPLPVQCLLLAAVLVFLLLRAWAVLRPAAPIARPVPPVDAGQAWRDATEQAGRAIAVHGVQGTRTVLDSLYQLPVRISGWSFVNAECQPEAIGHWHCRARYRRVDPKASNETLLEKAPPSWLIDFVSIDQAEPAWRIQTIAQSLMHAQIRSAVHNERHLWSSLQAIQPAFSRLQLGRPLPLAVAVPRDAQGKPVLRPKHLQAYTARQVRFEGPLRSVSVLLPYTESISWKKMTLSLHDARPVDVRTSRLHVSFHGDLYETQSGFLDVAHSTAVAPSSSAVVATPSP